MEDTQKTCNSDAPGTMDPVWRFVMMNPKGIDPSLFGPDVNPPSTPEEDLALKESIRRDGIQVPIRVGTLKGKSRHVVVNGTRRHKVALELRLSEIPVETKEYGSIEEMRQDALRDNLERRHLSKSSRAELANNLWRSYEVAPDKKEMAAQGLTPRKRAAIAGGLSEGTLASYRYVMDSGDVDIIADMRSGKLKIDAAYRLTKKKVEAGKSTDEEKELPVRMQSLIHDLDNLATALKGVAGLAKRAEGVMSAPTKGNRGDRERLVRKARSAMDAIGNSETISALAKLSFTLRCNVVHAPDSNGKDTSDS